MNKTRFSTRPEAGFEMFQSYLKREIGGDRWI